MSYTARKNLKAYHLAGGLSSGLHDTDFFEYELTTSQRYALGEQVKFRQQPFVIRELRAELEQGELHFHYVLARPDGIRRETLRNPLLRGISLEGEVLAVRGEEVQLRLEIDKDDGLVEPHWYPFAPPTGSAMYCLPQVGTKASLYYPDATGSGALIVGTVRKNGGESAKTSDTNTRYFGTEHGSELKLAPSHVNLQKDPEGAMLVSLNDETGIEITSPGKLTMTAELELELYTPQQIILGSESQILAYRGESEAGLVVESEYHLLGEKVWADGSDRTTYPPFDDEPELGEEPEPDPPFNWGKLVKNVLVGLAVVVAVAAVAALTVATLGAGPILIGAVASGALIGGAMGVGMMAVSDIARGEVSDMSDYALTGLKDSFIGAVSGAIFGPGAAVGTAFARKMGMAGAEGAFSSIMDQLLRGEKINWKTVAMDAGIGMFTLGTLDNKYAKQLGGFIGKIGNKISPASIKSGISKGMDKAAAGYQKALEKLSEAGSVLGKKMKDLGKHVVDFGEALNKDLNILAKNAKDFAQGVKNGFQGFSDTLLNRRYATENGLEIPHVNVSNSSRTPDLEITPERQRQIDALKNGEYSGTSGNKGTEGTGGISSYDKKRSVEDIKKELTEDTSNRAREILESGTSKKEMGPCLSGIHDPLTNTTFFGQNFKNNATMRQEYQKWIDNDADPIIKNLVKEYELKIASGEIKLSEVADTRLAAHSEIRALDQVLKARREANLPVNDSTISELFLHNIDLYKSDGVGNIVTKIRCENCRYLTDGINTVGHN